MSVDGLTAELQETLKFKPPRRASKQKRINLIQPRSSNISVGKVEQRISKKGKISTFERTHQFFAEARPNAASRFKNSTGKKSRSPLKGAASHMLRQSIENIELEHLENDFPKSPKSKTMTGKSQTPDKLKITGKSPLNELSSNKKVSQFETPKAQLSQVKIRQHGTESNNVSN